MPFWLARPDFVDTRLRPEETETPEFVFGRAAQKVRVRLLYRRFWQELTRAKDWPDDTLTVFEQIYSVSP